MRLHSIAPFHALADGENSHCAFTSLAVRYAKMMRAQGFEVVEYANESESEADERVPMLSRATVRENSTRRTDADFYGPDMQIGGALWRLFDRKLRRELTRRFDPDADVVCHHLGHSHADLAATLGGLHLEPSVGYNVTFARNRVFASQAWRAYHQGKNCRRGDSYEWVVPHFVDVAEWTPSEKVGDYLLYLGRIQADKGMSVVREVAERAGLHVIVCGQGDASPWRHPNIEPRPPVSGAARNALVAGARAMLLPTEYVEPGSVASIEALVCGTPVLSSDHGVFPERVVNGENGYRCKTLGDWLEAVRRAPRLDRSAIAAKARATYSLEALGPRHKAIVEQVADLRGEGWYSAEARNLD